MRAAPRRRRLLLLSMTIYYVHTMRATVAAGSRPIYIIIMNVNLIDEETALVESAAANNRHRTTIQ